MMEVPFETLDLDEEWQRKAEDEVQEKAEWRQRDIQELRNMVQKTQGLTCPTQDEFLLRFLRAQKFDYEGALNMLKRYFMMRRRYPQNFTLLDSGDLCQVTSVLCKGPCQQSVLPHRDREGRRVFLFRAGAWNLTEKTTADIFAANLLCLEAVAREPRTQVSGIVVVVDMADFGLSHALNVGGVEYVRSVADVIQNAFPLRFREIHIINESYLFDMVFALIKPFLSERIKARIVSHGSDLTAFTAAVGKNILPAEFGGDLGPMDNDQVVKLLEEHKQEFEDLYQRHGFDSDAEDVSEPTSAIPGNYCFMTTEES